MIVYTFQNPDILKSILEINQLMNHEGYWYDDMRGYYEWMYRQYKQRIGSQEKSLVWCWETIPEWYFEYDEEDDDYWKTEGSKKYRFRILLIVDVPESRILWSDYDSWYSPLNDGQILSENEQLEEEQGKVFAEQYGWERVFDFEWLIENGWSDEIIKQGVFDVVDVSSIKEIKYYDAKRKEFIDEDEFKRRV